MFNRVSQLNRLPRTHFRILGLLLGLCGGVFYRGSALAQDKDLRHPTQTIPLEIDDDELSQLINNIASSEFHVRESATERLQKLSFSSIDRLKGHFGNVTDPEARARLHGVIARLVFDRQQQIISAFIRDQDPNQSHGLDGWRRFSKEAGTSRQSKQLFLKMYDKFPELVEKELANKQEAFDKARSVASIIQEGRNNLASWEEADCLALLFCSLVADDLFDKNLERTSAESFRMSPFNRMLADSQFHIPFGAMLSSWSKRIEDYRKEALIIMMDFNYTQARGLAIEVLQSDAVKESDDEGTTQFVIAMQVLFRFGKDADLALVEKWLTDESVCYEGMGFAQQEPGKIGIPRMAPNPNAVVEMVVERRDIALVVATQLRQGNPMKFFRDFGIHDIRGFDIRSLLSPKGQPEIRAERVKKYDDWKEMKLRPSLN